MAIEVHFKYKKTGEVDWQETDKEIVTESADFYSDLPGLECNAEYEFYGIVEEDSIVIAEGDTLLFNTLEAPEVAEAYAIAFLISVNTPLDILEAPEVAEADAAAFLASVIAEIVESTVIFGYKNHSQFYGYRR